MGTDKTTFLKKNGNKYTNNVPTACPKILPFWIIFIFWKWAHIYFIIRKKIVWKYRYWWPRMSWMGCCEKYIYETLFPTILFLEVFCTSCPNGWLFVLLLKIFLVMKANILFKNVSNTELLHKKNDSAFFCTLISQTTNTSILYC